MSLLYRRLVGATGFSIQGLKSCFRYEEAFRVEVFLVVVLSPLGFYIGDSAGDFALLFGAMLIVLITELLNSAVEAVVDLVTSDKAELAGRAKDQASAAVMLSMILFVLVWATLAWPLFADTAVK
ncbi:MAG: diacylglycerol kinase [Gammaproteobacteria bacterium]|nr:diacylglycerol kinase [Gammaproteobacteria bacterium]MBQ0839614.1 diacylglycerol kinase [Gammaproteobacteria bacterium]